MDAEEFRRLGHALVDAVAAGLAAIPDGPVTTGEAPSLPGLPSIDPLYLMSGLFFLVLILVLGLLLKNTLSYLSSQITVRAQEGLVRVVKDAGGPTHVPAKG